MPSHVDFIFWWIFGPFLIPTCTPESQLKVSRLTFSWFLAFKVDIDFWYDFGANLPPFSFPKSTKIVSKLGHERHRFFGRFWNRFSDGPRRSPDRPRRRSKRQDGPKRPPRRPQDGPKRPQKFAFFWCLFDLGRQGPPRALRDPSKTDFWFIFGRFLVDFRWFLRWFLVDFSSRTPSYLDLVFISIFDPILFHFGIDHGAFDNPWGPIKNRFER